MKFHYALMLCTLSTFATGCSLRDVTFSHEERPHYYDDRPGYVQGPPNRDVIVVTEPPRAPVTVIREAPPAPYVERIPQRPRGDVVWVPGYWARDRNRWVWVAGHYERPPRRDARWVEPRWHRQGDEFRLELGFWR
jgi:hypothetical protein